MTHDDRPRESPLALYGAIAANIAIAATKFGVAAHTGSSALLSEAVHSTVDTGNEGSRFIVAWRQFLAQSRGRSAWQALRDGGRPEAARHRESAQARGRVRRDFGHGPPSFPTSSSRWEATASGQS